MSEARAPEPVRVVELPGDRVARLEQARKPRAARMLGQVHDQVVAPGRQTAQQPPLRRRLREPALALPFAIDGVQLFDRGMAFEHGRGFAVDQRVDFRGRQCVLQHREHRRGEQHVAVMAKLGDQRAADHSEVDRVLQRVEHAPTIAKCVV